VSRQIWEITITIRNFLKLRYGWVSFSEVSKRKNKSCEITSKIWQINTVKWLCSYLLKIQVTCNYCRCRFICSGRKIISWSLWFLISDFLRWFLISPLDFRFNVLISDFLTDFCDFFSWCTRFLCGVADRGVRKAAKSRTRLRNLCNFIKITLGLHWDYTRLAQGLHIFVIQELVDIYRVIIKLI